ncbi:MAG TPA: AAA domain-containing protein, partial [bacterium]|nr:AAA domain-containing protein [bacterium]
AVLKIRDCNYIEKHSIPSEGYIREKTTQKEQEKQRQLDAIRKVYKNEAQNPDLIYYLFRPKEMPSEKVDYSELEKVWQKDAEGNPIKYSLNQIKAIRNALNKEHLSVIQGPPGTGKTTVITEIVFQILATKPESKILITSQTNNAVDQVLENLINNNISVLRLSGMTQPRIEVVKGQTLDRKIDWWKQQVIKNAEDCFKRISEEFFITNPINLEKMEIVKIFTKNNDWEKIRKKIEDIAKKDTKLGIPQNLPVEKNEFISLLEKTIDINLGKFLRLYELHRDWIATVSAFKDKSDIGQKLIDSIRVIGATCNHIAAKKYSKYYFEFDYVIMDESGKATTAEALVPIVTGNTLIFVGDHRQLRPMLTNTNEVEKWLKNKYRKEASEMEIEEDEYFNRPSLFEKIITEISEDYKTQLTECRRASEDQVILTSKCFYEKAGDEEIIPVERDKSFEHNLPIGINSSILFIDIGQEYKSQKNERSGSSYNDVSAKLIPEILVLLNKHEKTREYSFGVIPAYTEQKIRIKRAVDRMRNQNRIGNISEWNRKEEKITVSVIDRFQGLERDICIVDLVKSGHDLDLGFLETPNRINVALSRQKRLLIIVGDYRNIVNARTKRLKGEKAALQEYLLSLKPEWIIDSSDIGDVL